MTSEPSQSRAEWRRFCKIVFLGTIPALTVLLLLLALLEWFGWSLGETYTPAALLRALDIRPDIVWMPDRVQSLAQLKLAQVAKERPEVLVMGQSRVEKIRAAMFRPYTFYNLSRVSWPFDTYTELLRHLPNDYHPKLILFNADFFMFSDEYEANSRGNDPVYGRAISEHLFGLRNVAAELLKHPQLASRRTDPTGRPALGIEAILSGQGFFKDGSEQPPVHLLARAGRSPGDLLGPSWKEYMSPGAKMDDAQMAALKAFVDLGHQKGIPMVAVQMPMYGPALRLLEQDPDYRVLDDFRRHVAQGYFEKLGIPFFDYLDFPPYSEDYRYFWDAIHPGQPLTAAVIEALGTDPRVRALLPKLDVDSLRRQLETERTAPQHIILNQE